MVLELKKDISSLSVSSLIKNQYEVSFTDQGYDILKSIPPTVLFCTKIPLIVFDNKIITSYGDIKVCLFNKDKKYISFITSGKVSSEPYTKTRVIKQRFIEKITK